MHGREVWCQRKAKEGSYQSCVCSVKTTQGSEKWFPVKTEVKQGTVLSRLLFLAYIETVIEDFKEGREDYKNRIIVYADGIAEWSTNQEEIEEDLTRWNECFLKKKV